MTRSGALSAVLVLGCLIALCGCATTTEIRIQNVSTYGFTGVRIAGQPYGEIAPGATTDYRSVKRKCGYLAMRLTADGRGITGQTLTFGSKRFTYRIGVKDCAARQLAIEIIRE